MSINLKKGGSINLSKEMTKLNKVMIGLGWEKTNMNIDLDASVFILGSNQKLIADDYFVFYNNLKSPDGAIQHTGDNRTGAAEDDDEIILANLETISPNAQELAICVSIHDAINLGHNFGLLKDAYIRIVDVDSKKEITKYDLDISHAFDNAVVFAQVRRSGNEWHFSANSQGSMAELQGLVDMYA